MEIIIDNIKEQELEITEYPNPFFRKIEINKDNLSDIYIPMPDIIWYINQSSVNRKIFCMEYKDPLEMLLDFYSEEDIINHHIFDCIEKYGFDGCVDKEKEEVFFDQVQGYLTDYCTKDEIVNFVKDIMKNNEIEKKDIKI